MSIRSLSRKECRSLSPTKLAVVVFLLKGGTTYISLNILNTSKPMKEIEKLSWTSLIQGGTFL